MLNLHRLRLFLAVAEYGSYSKAAAALHISQPAVSSQVHRLEEDLGVRLLRRSGREICLTEAGEALREYGRRIMDLCEYTLREMQEFSKIRTGRFRIGATATPGVYVLPSLLRQLTENHPTLNIELAIENRSQVLSHLLELRYDIALVAGAKPDNPELTAIHLANEELIPFGSASSRLARKALVTAKEFLSERIFVREPGSGTRQTVEAVIAQLDVTPREMIELPNNEAIRQAVIANMGYSLLFRSAVQNELQNGCLVEFDIPELHCSRGVWLVYHKQQPIAATVRSLFETLAPLSAHRP